MSREKKKRDIKMWEERPVDTELKRNSDGGGGGCGGGSEGDEEEGYITGRVGCGQNKQQIRRGGQGRAGGQERTRTGTVCLASPRLALIGALVP